MHFRRVPHQNNRDSFALVTSKNQLKIDVGKDCCMLSLCSACVCRSNGTAKALDRGNKSGEEVGAYDVNDMGDIYINFYIK